jgi:predicted kinase
MPKCYILIGVPGAGKSTWISKAPVDWNNTVVASTDNYVEKVAKQRGKTYSEVFKEVMPKAVHEMARTVRKAVEAGQDIIWDQTSTTIGSRAKKFNMLPDDYEVIAVVFPTPEPEEHARRLKGREGKNIPDNVMRSMINGWQEPTEAEGFSKIIYVR